jgi:hypothetical protein
MCDIETGVIKFIGIREGKGAMRLKLFVVELARNYLQMCSAHGVGMCSGCSNVRRLVVWLRKIMLLLLLMMLYALVLLVHQDNLL